MAQRKITEMFNKPKNDENARRTRAGLPEDLFEDVINLGSPPSGTRRPLTKVQRSRVAHSLHRQQRLTRQITQDLEFVADGLIETNPRSAIRERQQELHRRQVTRLLEATEIVNQLTHVIERDDEDRNYWFAHEAQRREVEEYEARVKDCQGSMTQIRPRDLQPQLRGPSTSRQALEERAQCIKRDPSLSPESKRRKIISKAHNTAFVKQSPRVIPESPAMRLPTPLGSRRSKNRLQRTLTPSLRRCATSKPSSSSSDGTTIANLTKKNKKLYKKLNAKLELEAVSEAKKIKSHSNVDTCVPPVLKVESQDLPSQWPNAPQTPWAPQQQQLQTSQPPQPQDQPREPRRRQSSVRYGDNLQTRLDFHSRSRLNQPLDREYPLKCEINCVDFDLNYLCDHTYVVPDPTLCPINCPQFTFELQCPHLVEAALGDPLPFPATLGSAYNNLPEPEPATFPERPQPRDPIKLEPEDESEPEQ